MARLGRQLGSAAYADREAATRKLEAVGEPALPALLKAEGSADLEVRRRARDLVAGIRRKIYGALHCFIGHTGGVWMVARSPDSRLLLSASDDKTLRLWDVQRGRQVRELTGHTGSVCCGVFSPDGRQVASAG